MGFDYKQLTAPHIKAARALLSWEQKDLVAASSVSLSTVQTVERGGSVLDRTLRDIFNAFEKEGIEFFNGEEPGVRRRKKAGD